MKAYHNSYKRSGLARVHIIRETQVNRYRSTWSRDFPQAWCGVTATDTTASPKVPVDPTGPLEEGLAWCGTCLGRAAEHAGILPRVVALLVTADQHTDNGHAS